MPHRPGGLEHTEINHALGVLNQVASRDDMEKAVDSVPALSAPVVHAILRQEYLRLQNAKNPSLANFEPRYHDLFFVLHTRWHQRQVREARAAFAAKKSSEAAANDVLPFVPPFYAAVMSALGVTAPANRGPHHDPVSDRERLQDELRSLLGREVVLPEATPSQGTRWCALMVGCGACGRPRLDVRGYAADLVVAPDMAVPLRERRINNSRCRSCGEVLAFPLRVWIVEAPGPPDPLAALSCVWRIAPDVFCYQPPPGTRREEQNDRILEVRFDQLCRSVPWPPAQAVVSNEGASATTISVAYSAEELVHALERATPDADRMPPAMESMIGEMTRKVESGVLPLHQAMDAVLNHVELLGKDWPILHPGVARQWQGPPLAHLFQSLVGEGVLRAQAAKPETRAVFAATTASSLLALGKNGLAEAALARADDCLASAASGRARDLSAMMIADIRADLLESLGRYDESAGVRAALSRASELGGDDLPARFARQGLASQEALGLFMRGQIARSLDAFRQCMGGWQTLLEDAKRSAGATAGPSTLERAAMHGESGDLANLAAVFTAIAEDLAAAHPDPASARDRLREALPALEPFFGEEISRDRLMAAADDLLRRALVLSEEVEGWEFAGVQAHRLAALHAQMGDLQTAEQFADRAIRHAARAGDHERVWTAAAFLAARALDRKDGPAALERLETSAREHIRHEVGLGQHAELTRAASSLSEAAFQAVAVGGDPLRAVMIAESLRAAATAASIITGTPSQPSKAGTPETIARLREDREKLELQLIWSPDDGDARARLAAVEGELASERQRIALRDPRHGRWVDASDVDVASTGALLRTLAQLGPNSLWFGGLAVNDQLWTWTVGANGADVRSVARPGVLVADGGDAPADGGRWTEPVLVELSEALLAPHRERLRSLQPDDVLVISVAGPLQQVPFAALPWAGKRLCEQATLVAVHGFGIFEAALQRPRLPFSSIALIGGPKRPDLPPLPGATAEVKAIARLLEDAGRTVTLASGAKATVRAFTEAAATHDAIHVSCHAVVDPPPGNTARLMLSLDMVRGDSGDLSEAGIMAEVELKPGCFVNLAGCATGQTRESGACALGGLVPAFLVAGARSVVASLWPIEDGPAARLQEAIYRHIVAGARPAAALAAAQRQLLKGELGAEFCSPSVWAAYALYGAN